MRSSGWIVVFTFFVSIAATLALLLRRPYLRIRIWRRHMRVETFFLGALLGPLLITSFGFLRFSETLSSLKGHEGLRPLGILALFLSMVFLSIFLDVTGVFDFCARWSLRRAGGDGRRLFFIVYATVSLLTVFTSNDIIILTFTPIIYYYTLHARINPLPYLIAEFFAANTWSTLLSIGNPTNIVIAGAFRLGFVPYAAAMAGPTFAAGAANLAGLYLIFRRDIVRPIHTGFGAPPEEALTDRPGALLGVALMAICLLGLALAPQLGLEMWEIALGAALGLLAVLIARRSWARFLGRDLNTRGGPGVRRTLGRMPWAIAPFVLAMFVTVDALRRFGFFDAVRAGLEGLCGASPALRVFVYGTASAASANVLNNIPMTLAFTAIIEGLPMPARPAAAFATAIGSNLGANLTPLGALAGLMWMSILHHKAAPIRFRDFVRYGLLVTPLSLLAALAVLALQFTGHGVN